MSAWAKLGVQCMCIETGWSAALCAANRLPTRLPELREILTISGVKDYLGDLYLRFEEIPDTGSNGGWFFLIDHFRPLNLQEHDVQLFASLLQSKPAADFAHVAAAEQLS